MTDKKSGGIASFGVSFGKPGAADPPAVGERAPFRVVVLAALTADSEHSTGAPPSTDVLPIDKQSFDAVMGTLAPSFALEISDPFVPTDPPLRVDLKWTELRMLRPDAIVEQVPALRALVDAKRIVQQVEGRKLSAADARAHLTRILPRASWADSLTREVTSSAEGASRAAPVAARAAAAPSSGTGLDALFDKVELAAAPPVIIDESASSPVPMPPPDTAPMEDRFASIVSAVARGTRPAERATAVVGKAPERVDRAFARILSEILQDPQVRSLERTWRGLKLLVDRADFRAGVEIGVVAAGVDEVEAALVRVGERRGEEAQRAPIDLLVIDHEVRPTPAELDRMERWATIAEAMRAPVVVNGAAALLGVDDLEALGKSKKRLTQHDDPRARALRAIASRDASRWLSIAINRVLVRLPYSASTSRVRDLSFAEDARDASAHVFAGAVYAVASLAAASYVRVGWPCAMVGPRNGVLENLPVREVKEAAGEYALPLEALISTEAQAEVARCGVTALSCAPNHDAAILSHAPMLYRGPALAAGDAAAQMTLPDQLFAARVSHAVEQLAAAIPRDTASATVRDVTRIGLAELFAVGSAPRAPEVSVQVDEPRHSIEVTVKPHGFVGVDLEELTFAAELGA